MDSTLCNEVSNSTTDELTLYIDQEGKQGNHHDAPRKKNLAATHAGRTGLGDYVIKNTA